MLTHTVLMPVAHPRFFPTLVEHMEGQGVIWRPIWHGKTLVMDKAIPDAKVKSEHGCTPYDIPERPWIKPWKCDLPCDKWGEPTINPGNHKYDAFFKWAEEYEPEFFSEDNYVSLMSDDCLWSYNYWIKLRRHFIKKKRDGAELAMRVIISAHMFGNNIVPAVCQRGPDDELWKNNNCRTFCTRNEALTCQGALLKGHRYGHLWCADGMLVEKLVEQYVNQSTVAFCNDALVYFNALRPEQWGFTADHQK